MTVTPPKFIAKPLEASVIEKIELSLSQCENIEKFFVRIVQLR